MTGCLGSPRCRSDRHTAPQTWTCNQPTFPPMALRTCTWAAVPVLRWSPELQLRAHQLPGNLLGNNAQKGVPGRHRGRSALGCPQTQVPGPARRPPGLHCAWWARPGRSAGRRAPYLTRQASSRLLEPQSHPAVITTL